MATSAQIQKLPYVQWISLLSQLTRSLIRGINYGRLVKYVARNMYGGVKGCANNYVQLTSEKRNIVEKVAF